MNIKLINLLLGGGRYVVIPSIRGGVINNTKYDLKDKEDVTCLNNIFNRMSRNEN